MHAEVLRRHEHSRAEALHLQRAAQLVREHRVEPVRREHREGQEARGGDGEERRHHRERAPAAAPLPQVGDRDREQHGGPELRSEAETDQGAAHDRPLLDDRHDGADREQRRPEVEPRVEEGPEHDGRDADQQERGPDPFRACIDGSQHQGSRDDASGAEHTHQHCERRRVAPGQVRRQD